MCPLSALRAGNRLIFEHVASHAEQYLKWRASRSRCGTPIDPAVVLKHLKLSPPKQRVVGVTPSQSTTSAAAARRVYDVLQADPAAADADLRPKLSAHRSVDIMAAAFALYERAGAVMREPGRTAADAAPFIHAANNAIAVVEQSEAAPPAFRPAPGGGAHTYTSVGDTAGRVAVMPGEVPRDALMFAMTPFVKLGFNTGSWALDGFDKQAALDLDWGLFRDRYLPIIHGAFRKAYATPRALWPPPPLDH